MVFTPFRKSRPCSRMSAGTMVAICSDEHGPLHEKPVPSSPGPRPPTCNAFACLAATLAATLFAMLAGQSAQQVHPTCAGYNEPPIRRPCPHDAIVKGWSIMWNRIHIHRWVVSQSTSGAALSILFSKTLFSHTLHSL